MIFATTVAFLLPSMHTYSLQWRWIYHAWLNKLGLTIGLTNEGHFPQVTNHGEQSPPAAQPHDLLRGALVHRRGLGEKLLPWRWGPWSRPSRSFSSTPPVEGLPSPSPWRSGQQCPWQPGRNAGNEIKGETVEKKKKLWVLCYEFNLSYLLHFHTVQVSLDFLPTIDSLWPGQRLTWFHCWLELLFPLTDIDPKDPLTAPQALVWRVGLLLNLKRETSGVVKVLCLVEILTYFVQFIPDLKKMETRVHTLDSPVK